MSLSESWGKTYAFVRQPFQPLMLDSALYSSVRIRVEIRECTHIDGTLASVPLSETSRLQF
jgi:hypothetical protein